MPIPLKPSVRDFSLSAASAGFVAVLVGFTSSVAIVFQAAVSLGATPHQFGSWMWALCLGMGLGSLLPSLWLRKPGMVAWSTPGAAVLASAGAAGAYTLPEAVGAFIVSAALITVSGVTGWFERIMDRIPIALASTLLAGVLARFGMDAFVAAQSATALVLLILLTYLLCSRLWPRYAVPVVLAVGVVFALAEGRMRGSSVVFALAAPVFTAPEFSGRATLNLALPLFVVTMASQNLPGVAAIRSAGYAIPISRIIALTGVLTLVLPPFGAFALNLAAITAAICMGGVAHSDPKRRYIAAAVCGAIYCAIAVFGAAVAGALSAFPRELVLAVAGLALLSSTGGGLAVALKDERHRESALIVFLVTLSGVSFVGVSSAFWGVLAGALALFVQQWRFRSQRASPL